MTFLKKLNLTLIATAILLAAVDAWSSGYAVNPMGISYLDMGSAVFHGHLSAVINGLWSPLYALPLGLAVVLFRPAPVWEFPLLHFVNFLIFLVTVAAFDFLISEVLRWRNNRSDPTGLPDWAIMSLGYALFIWCSLGLITIATTAPDLLLSAAVYLAFALLFRIRRGLNGPGTFLFLGLSLGIGYLTKAVMMPLAPFFILIGLILACDIRRSFPRLGAAVLGLLLMAGPLIVGLSVTKHRLTIGDSGRLNYLWHVNKVPFFHWRGDDRFGFMVHPTRMVFANPAIYEFASPITATYAPWYDPSYWYEGPAPRFDLKQQLEVFRTTIRIYLEIFTFTSHLLVIAGFFVLLYLTRDHSFWSVLREWPLFVLILICFAIYFPVHIEPRYVAAFIPPLWLILYAGLRFPSSSPLRKYAAYFVIAVASILILAQASRSVRAFQAAQVHTGATQLEVAAKLTNSGLRPGDAVGMINFNPFWLPIVHWAQLAGVRVVAELPNTETDTFLRSDESRKQQVLETFRKTGAKAVIAAEAPEGVSLPGWKHIGNTRYYVLQFDQP